MDFFLFPFRPSFIQTNKVGRETHFSGVEKKKRDLSLSILNVY